MNIKNNKGITLIALIITVIIILIIGGITIYEGSKLVDEAKYEDVKTNMLLLQAEIKNYVEQAKFENKELKDIIGDDKGITLNDVTLIVSEPEGGSSIAKEIDNIKAKTNAEIDLYQIKTDMNELNLGSIDPDKYLVSIDITDTIDVDVCFLPGILGDDGITHYFLSEL